MEVMEETTKAMWMDGMVVGGMGETKVMVLMVWDGGDGEDRGWVMDYGSEGWGASSTMMGPSVA